ncbi:phospholipase-like protein [Tanacetum coccineum]
MRTCSELPSSHNHKDKKDNISLHPVIVANWEKVLMICAAKLKPHPSDMSIALYDYPNMVARICETTSPMMKRKRDNEHVIPLLVETILVLNMLEQAVQNGDILVGTRIRVWCSKDENYRPGVVKLFDPLYKMHTVLYDDGYAEQIDLKCKRWILLEIVTAVSDSSLEQELPNNVSSPQTDITCVESYKVKNINARILEAIIKKHGDIAAECVFKTPCVRESFLEVICEIVKPIETNDVRTIISNLEEIDRQVSEAKAANINVSWLQPHLEAIQKENKAQKNSSLLMETKVNTILVKKAAQTDLTERSMELVAAQKRFEIAESTSAKFAALAHELPDFLYASADIFDDPSCIG